MYAFSVKPTGRKVNPETAPPPPAHTIRAPCETSSPPPNSDGFDEPDGSVSPHLQQQQQLSVASRRSPPPSHLAAAAAAPSNPPLHVYNLSAYVDMRDAADWSAVVQRERAEKRARALAAHDAAKAAEQQRRAAAEAQSACEALRRKEERQQQQLALREADAVADFQERNTQFLLEQQQLMQLSAAAAHAEQQRKARVRDEVYKTWMNTQQGGGGGVCGYNTGGYSPASTLATTAGAASASTASRGLRASGVTPGSTFSATAAATQTAVSSSAREGELRESAQRTEEAYVRLSLAYRHEAQRSRAAAVILAAADSGSPPQQQQQQRTTAVSSSSAGGDLTAAYTATASAAPVPVAGAAVVMPFRTAPAMYSHDSEEHMGRYAHEIPSTYIPEHFDNGKGGRRAVMAMNSSQQQQQRGGGQVREIMPLPLQPTAVSAEVSDALRDAMYPWAALADPTSGATAAKPSCPPREAYLPVQDWGAARLQASRYGHNANPDGTMQQPCERRRECAARLGHSTIPQDNATATSNSPEAVPKIRPGKRQEVWL